MTNTAAPPPPPILEGWRIAVLVVVLPIIVGWAWWITPPAQAATLGYRLEVEACRGAECRPLSMRAEPLLGQFGCQDRADTLRTLTDAPILARAGLKGVGWVLRARCVVVEGMPTA